MLEHYIKLTESVIHELITRTFSALFCGILFVEQSLSCLEGRAIRRLKQTIVVGKLIKELVEYTFTVSQILLVIFLYTLLYELIIR